MLLVVHIPKTTGTSLRQALVAQFGKRRVACVCGVESTVVSREIMTRLYALNQADVALDRDARAVFLQIFRGELVRLVSVPVRARIISGSD